MNEQFGIPWISVSFYGKRDTSFAIREIVNALGDPELIARAEVVIAESEADLEEKIAPYKVLFAGKKAVLNTGGNKAWSIASGLQDLGIEVVATSVAKSTQDDIDKAREYLGENGVLMTKPASEQGKVIDFVREYKLLEDLDDEMITETFNIFPHCCSWDKELGFAEIDSERIGIAVDKIMEVLDESFEHEYTAPQITEIAASFF